MTWRTPSSLKWLIDKRSRLAGLLSQLIQEQTELDARLEIAKERIATVQRQLQALDCTFELHEVQIEPQEIAPVSPQKKTWLMPHGRMSRLILNALRDHGGWMPTTLLTVAVASQVSAAHDSATPAYVRRAVRRRLGGLLRAGRIERDELLDEFGLHDGFSEAFWRIRSDSF